MYVISIYVNEIVTNVQLLPVFYKAKNIPPVFLSCTFESPLYRSRFWTPTSRASNVCSTFKFYCGPDLPYCKQKFQQFVRDILFQAMNERWSGA